MRRDISDDAFDGPFAGVNHHALRPSDRGIDAAQLTDINEPFGVDEVDGHGDFVRVARQHQARGTALVQHGDGVAIGIAESFVGELFGVIEPHALSAKLVSGGAGSVQKPFQELD